MFTLGKEAIYYKSNISKWTFLAFQGGSINVIGVLAGHRFVSHVTGFATLAGVEFAGLNWTKGLSMLSVPLFFLLGAMVSGYFIDLRVSHHRRGGYQTILFMIFCCLFVSFLASVVGLFGTYGEDFSVEDHYALLVLLSMTCGLQNAMITTASGSIIRTTHLTGISTDLGIGISRLLFGKTRGIEIENPRMERAALWMRTTIIVAFTLGSLITAMLARFFGYWSLLLPCLTSFGLWIFVKFEEKKIFSRVPQ
jgi:uncharacterized membrane protein YoaK (UPF0700 family)